MSEKYVFVDWSNIEAGYGVIWPYTKQPRLSPSGIELKAHRPIIEPDTVMKPDKPWESYCINVYSTFIRDGDKIRCWYECFPDETMDDMKSYFAYAESDDGIHWVKPSLGLFEFNGSTDNNIIKNVHGTSVLLDEDAPADERYKMIWVMYIRNDPQNHWCRIHGAVSPDGIHWNDLPEPILDNPGDTQNSLAYDRDIGKYIIYTRPINGYPIERRSIARTESADFRHFPQPAMMLHSDPNDPPDWDYYTSGYMKWPGAKNAHLMLFDMYHRTDDSFDVHLATSRDGLVWYRPMGREAYIPNTEHGTFGDKIISSTAGLIDGGDGRWFIYVSGQRTGHNATFEEITKPFGGYWRAAMREDGFMSVTVAETGGFHTVPVRVKGDSVMINAACSPGGSIKVAIVDKTTGVPVKDFTLDNCDYLNPDAVWQKVTWKGDGDISELSGKEIRLQFSIYEADIYAFRI